MAFFTFPVLRGDLVWSLAAVTLFACFLGRVHVFVFLPLTNAVRRRIAHKQVGKRYRLCYKEVVTDS
jgi:hypothetical protein